LKTKTLIVGLSLIALSLGVSRGKNVEAETKAGPSSVDAVQIHAHLDRPLLVRGGGEQKMIVKIEVTGTP